MDKKVKNLVNKFRVISAADVSQNATELNSTDENSYLITESNGSAENSFKISESDKTAGDSEKMCISTKVIQFLEKISESSKAEVSNRVSEACKADFVLDKISESSMVDKVLEKLFESCKIPEVLDRIPDSNKVEEVPERVYETNTFVKVKENIFESCKTAEDSEKEYESSNIVKVLENFCKSGKDVNKFVETYEPSWYSEEDSRQTLGSSRDHDFDTLSIQSCVSGHFDASLEEMESLDDSDKRLRKAFIVESLTERFKFTATECRDLEEICRKIFHYYPENINSQNDMFKHGTESEMNYIIQNVKAAKNSLDKAMNELAVNHSICEQEFIGLQIFIIAGDVFAVEDGPDLDNYIKNFKKSLGYLETSALNSRKKLDDFSDECVRLEHK